jgi:hypothetical protein
MDILGQNTEHVKESEPLNTSPEDSLRDLYKKKRQTIILFGFTAMLILALYRWVIDHILRNFGPSKISIETIPLPP